MAFPALPSPYTAALITALLLPPLTFVLLNTAYTRGHTAGMSKVLAEWNQADKARTEATNQALTALIARANQLQNQLNTQATRHHQEQTHAQAEITRLRSAVRAGTVRLSIPSTCTNAAYTASPTATSPGPAGEPPAPRTQLDPATADALVAITADGDTAIRDLNACIEHYRTVTTPLD